jgi:hypothetical protein
VIEVPFQTSKEKDGVVCTWFSETMILENNQAEFLYKTKFGA